MKCPKCNTDNPSDSKFCKECTTPLPGAEEVSFTRTMETPREELTTGSLFADRYQIIKELGKGGMGYVYKAQDIKLKRTIALKFLPPELIRDEPAKKRFIREAQATSALDHPNVCTIHEIDETDDGRMFISMACYEGESLKEKIEKGPLKIKEAVDIAAQIAKGLGIAHKKGIVHRDIKPANIMITQDGTAKIVDFGLAKLADQIGLSRPDTILGTVAYMSPEQARGEEVDHRTDIWSLGVVLYQMLSRQLPFKGERPESVIYSILKEDPESILSHCPDIPTNIAKVLGRALEKDASKRYQNTVEFIQDLEQPPPITLSKAEKSIIVLPFENLSPDPDQDYFCDGMTEEIITDLSKINSLLVISRSSAMTFKGTKKKIREIVRDVNVEYVLEGSVRKAGNSLRITAQLIEAEHDIHLWAEKYSGTLDDVFDIQEKVSHSILNALKLKLGTDEKKRIAERPIDNIKAYEYYLRAKHENAQFTAGAAERALQYLRQAQKIVGDNVNIYEAMAEAYFVLSHTKIGEEIESLEKVEECVNSIFELDQESSYGYLYLGIVRSKEPKPLEGIKLLKKAFDIEPNNTETLKFLGFCAAEIGKPVIAEPCARKLMEINPLDPWSPFLSGWLHIMEGRSMPALKEFKKAYQMAPAPIWGFKYARTLAINHQLREAYSIFGPMIKNFPEDPWSLLGSLYQYALQGKKQKALALVTEDFKSAVRWDETESWYLAGFYALIDEKNAAIDWLENAVWRGFLNYLCLNEYDPFLENIRGELRFKKLMERVKYEWENFEV